MIKLQTLALILATVVAEVRKTYPMIPARFLKLKGLQSIVFAFEDRIPLCIQCTEPNGVNARIQCLNDLLKGSDLLRDNGDHPVSITLMFNKTRGNMKDTYYL